MNSTFRVVALQGAIGALCTLAFFAYHPSQGSAAAMATAALVLPSGYYAWMLQRTLKAARILAHGVLKMLATLTLMGVVIVVWQAQPLGFFVTLVLMQVAYVVPSSAKPLASDSKASAS